MALLIVIVGILGVSAGVVGYLVCGIREVDVLLADHDVERASGDAIAASRHPS